MRNEELVMSNAFLTSHFSLLISDGVRFGGLAQLARAPALQAGGQRFESVILHRFKTWPLYIVHCPFVLESDL